MWTDEIWLVINIDTGVQRMTKRQPTELKRGEVPVKVLVEVEPKALRPPTLIRTIKIADWREGLDVSGDINLKQLTISPEEAELIKARRREQQLELLREMGYTITPPPVAETDGNDDERQQAPP
jgi:hypothetical protein